jgi:hypothetical protein
MNNKNIVNRCENCRFLRGINSVPVCVHGVVNECETLLEMMKDPEYMKFFTVSLDWYCYDWKE